MSLHWDYLPSSAVTDGEDGNGLKLEKKVASFFKFSSCVCEKAQKKLLWLALPDKFRKFSENDRKCSYELWTLFGEFSKIFGNLRYSS